MIEAGSYERSWLDQVSDGIERKVDKLLLEKVIYAITLLEQLKRSGLDFIFKGGTSLLLKSSKPRRFSIDIDLVVDRDPAEIPGYLDHVVSMGIFSRWVPDNERKTSADVPVAHYKFYYSSRIDSYFGEQPMLLDLLFAKDLYPATADTVIQHSWIITSGDMTSVRIPDNDALLGDKLSAFAPNTTGILYSKQRPVEMIKQLFDIGYLFNEIRDIELVRRSYQKNVAEEPRYRKLNIEWQDTLDDSFQAARLLSRKETSLEEFKQLQKGITNISNFILEKFTLEEAIVCASKAAYLTVLLRRNAPAPLFYSGPQSIASLAIESDPKLNRLKRTNPEAFFYWHLALQ